MLTRRSGVLVPVLLVFVVATAAFVWFGDSLRKGEDSLIQRRYADAVGHLEQALAEEPEARRDVVLLLLGRAQWLGGEHQAAVATYRRLCEGYPDSGLLHKARLMEAECLAQSKQFREAAALYRAEVERLTGPSRKEDVAGTYLGLADKALKKEPPDYGRAVVFYDLAVDLGLSAERCLSIRLLAADALLRSQQWGPALERLTPLVEELSIEHGKLRAMLGLGRARSAAGDKVGARKALRDLIALAKAAPEAADAAYEVALTYGVPSPDQQSLDRAISALTDLARRYPQHPKAKVARFLMAQCYAASSRTEAALESLHAFLSESRGEPLDEVAEALAMVGDVLALQGKLSEAIGAWRRYLTDHPAHRDWERVQRAIVDAEFHRAQDAYQAGKERFAEARELFAAFGRDHPLDVRNPGILLVLGEMLLDEEHYDEARAAYERCVSKYPGKEESSRAQFRIGEIFEQKTFNYGKALDAYRALTWGSWAQQARERIARLERKHLFLKTPRSFRTGETAHFLLTSRNIPEVRVRIYRLDLETWFRATHLAGDVDRLDIEVIEPDQTLQSEVPEYAKYRETEREVAIPFDRPGAYVVKVDDKDLQATTMVLITDLAMIAKTSRHEFFVFTQNVKEDRAEAGVEVVLSDGKGIIAEGTTGADGVWRYQGKELQDCDQLRAFVVDAAGSGAGTLDLSGLGHNQGLVPKGFLFTDRPAYQPGQTVHMKGIVREVQDGLYRLPEATYRLHVSTASGRTILQREARFTPFGTLAADVVLPADAELGDWRILLTSTTARDTVFSGGFRVARYELPRLSMQIEPSERVVFRGERIAGDISLRYYYGEPAVGKTVEFAMSLPDGGQVRQSGVTNAAGVVAFDFDTKEFAEEGVALIHASVAEDNVQAAVAVPVVTTEFTPTLSMVRPIYLAGEPFDVTVEIVDRTGKPLARTGTLRLLRKEQRARGVGEVEVRAEAFRTAAGDGRARVTMTAAEGGSYVARVESEDRFGHVVTQSLELTVSGDEDEIKLRMLSDRQFYQVGDTVQVKVVNRAGARLALRTVQGDGILTYQALRLPAGESVLSLLLEPVHAPNFGLALAMIDGQELRTAEREFVVARDLRLEVAPAADLARPGEKIEVRVTAKDPSGQPVEAEVALALVDASLYDLYADATPKMNPFFYGQRRETSFRTTSSCSWAYEGPSSTVSRDILAEERRELERNRAADEPARSEAGDDGFFARGRTRADRPQSEAPGAGGQPQALELLSARQAQLAQPDQQAFGFLVNTATIDNLDARLKGLASLADQDKARIAFDLSKVLSAEGKVLNVQGFTAVLGVPLATEIPLDQPRAEFSASGGWLSSVVTGADGRAVVELQMPDSTTEWRLTGRAVTRDTYVGEATGAIKTQKELQADLVAPWALTEGDRAEIEARVHNRTGEPLAVRMKLETRAGERDPAVLERRVELPAGREVSERLELVAAATDPLSLDLSVHGGAFGDALRRTVPVLPFGVEQRVGHAGRLTEATTFRLSLPQGREYGGVSLRIEVGPDPGRDLVAAALGLGYRPSNCGRIDRTNLSIASRGLAALHVLAYLEASGAGIRADGPRLDALVQSCLTGLLSVQADDGGFAWIGKKGGDLRTTSQVARFLGLCRRHGIEAAEPALAKAADWLLDALRSVREDERTLAALALADVGRARFETLNSLHRRRASMALDHLARLCLAWQAAQRPDMAREALAELRARLTLPASTDPAHVEAVGLAAAALLRSDAADRDAARAVEWLEGRRSGASWGTPSATAAALMALCAAGGADRSAASEAEIDIEVNGQKLATVPTAVKTATAGFDVPAGWLKEQGNQVELRVRGRGTVHYSAVLTGFARGFDESDRHDELVVTRRKYMPAFLRRDNDVVRPGFSVVSGRYQSFENLMTELPVGGTGRVETYFWVRGEEREPRFSPVVVEEPIPAGCTVPKDSIQGSFDYVDVEPDRMVFYYREGVRSDTIRYELLARFPGSYRALPTAVYGALRPDLLAHGPVGTLKVLPRGSATGDPYRMTPDELYRIGKALFDAGELLAAGRHLDQLLAGWTLRDDGQKDVVRMMLFVAIERHDSAGIVRSFEELKDRFPDLVIPFDKILAVGQAYIDIGEFEAALLVFRATAEASFLKEAAVATTLEQMGELKSAMRFLRGLLVTYPDLNTMRASLYGIGQKLSAVGAALPAGAPVDERVGRREELQRQAVATFRDFLILYPEDPMAEEVSFSWATTLVEASDLEGALQVAEAALARYPGSSLEDELLYTAGYIRFALGQTDQAFDILKRVAEQPFNRPDGGRGSSENKKHAIYLQGQIHHALDQPQQALAKYDEVKDDFSDAVEAASYFRRKGLTLPEVTTFALGDEGGLKIGYRNLEQLTVKVYRVDLMRLYLLHKSLDDIRNIRLHGIQPYLEQKVELGDGKDYRDLEKVLQLPLNEPGAYLVVARSGDLLASGMVLRSDLKIEPQEELDSGRIRVNVKRGQAFQAHAHVKVVGSGDGRIRSGDTDLRGVFVADDLVGQATVIVEHDDGYAFYRGPGINQPDRFRPPPPPQPSQAKPAAEDHKRKSFDAWEQNFIQNDMNRNKQIEWLEKEVLQRQQRGVEVYRTK